MTRDFLMRLYWACSAEEASLADGRNLGKLYERTEATGEADCCFDEYLYTTNLTAEEKDALYNLSADAITAYEQQGFINGFRLGMKLAGELGGEEAGGDE